LFPSSGPDYQPVVTLNGWSLPWRMNGDWKEFHLVAEPVRREHRGNQHDGASQAVAVTVPKSPPKKHFSSRPLAYWSRSNAPAAVMEGQGTKPTRGRALRARGVYHLA
jgi:hypothetical protein